MSRRLQAFPGCQGAPRVATIGPARGVAQLGLARSVRDAEVEGSNPSSPTSESPVRERSPSVVFAVRRPRALGQVPALQRFRGVYRVRRRMNPSPGRPAARNSNVDGSGTAAPVVRVALIPVLSEKKLLSDP